MGMWTGETVGRHLARRGDRRNTEVEGEKESAMTPSSPAWLSGYRWGMSFPEIKKKNQEKPIWGER